MLEQCWPTWNRVCKQTQHVTPNNVGTMLANMQQDLQTEATCNTQQCWNNVGQHVCVRLHVTLTRNIEVRKLTIKKLKSDLDLAAFSQICLLSSTKHWQTGHSLNQIAQHLTPRSDQLVSSHNFNEMSVRQVWRMKIIISSRGAILI